MSHTTCSFWIPPSVLTLNAPTNDRTHTHTTVNTSSDYARKVVMSHTWTRTKDAAWQIWFLVGRFAVFRKNREPKCCGRETTWEKKTLFCGFLSRFSSLLDETASPLHSTHTHTHTRPHAVSYKDGTSVIKTNIGGDRRPVRTPIKNTVRAQVCVWVGVSSGSRFPPLKGCLFAKKEEGKQPRPHKHTHTHNPKSRRVSPMNITEREWGSEEGSAAICCIMTHSLWVYQLSICITPSQSACCHTRPECLSSFPQITRYDASS